MWLMTTPTFLANNITIKITNQKENTKDKLGVTALVAIMEPATETQFSRAHKQPLRIHPSKKPKSYWIQGPMETFISYQKEMANPFPT